MPAALTHIDATTPMGATLVDGGATFRVWAPHAEAVYVTNGEGPADPPPEAGALSRLGDDWAGFVPGVKNRDRYRFWIQGKADSGPKRDPYARELDAPDCVIRTTDFPWHDTGYVTTDYHDLVIYHLQVGTFRPRGTSAGGTFLDVALKIPYLRDLGISAIQLLPISEFQSPMSMGYNGTDLYSPETDYALSDDDVTAYLGPINAMLTARGLTPYVGSDLRGELNQFKALVDLCHVHDIAVILDVVYNHAGDPLDDQSIRCFDRETPAAAADRTKLTYFGAHEHCGPVFDFGKPEVRRFLVDNARYFARECRVDGFRYDQVSVIDHEGAPDGWAFCQEVTAAVRAENPRAVQIAEYWPVNPYVVARPGRGAGFDTTLTDGLRDALRRVVVEASHPDERPLDMTGIAAALWPAGFGQHWQFVQGPENHDNTYASHDGAARLARLAHRDDPRSSWGRSRTRAATAISLTAPGIPMLFMGQEFLEDKCWIDKWTRQDLRLYWDGMDRSDRQMWDHYRFVAELARLRRALPGLHGQGFRVVHVHDQNRVLAVHRWVPDVGHDVLVVAHLGSATKTDYRIGFPCAGRWAEVFNSDVYENWVNPNVAGNNGAAYAEAQPLHGFDSSAPALALPANSVLVFAR